MFNKTIKDNHSICFVLRLFFLFYNLYWGFLKLKDHYLYYFPYLTFYSEKQKNNLNKRPGGVTA